MDDMELPDDIFSGDVITEEIVTNNNVIIEEEIVVTQETRVVVSQPPPDIKTVVVTAPPNSGGDGVVKLAPRTILNAALGKPKQNVVVAAAPVKLQNIVTTTTKIAPMVTIANSIQMKAMANPILIAKSSSSQPQIITALSKGVAIHPAGSTLLAQQLTQNAVRPILIRSSQGQL